MKQSLSKKKITLLVLVAAVLCTVGAVYAMEGVVGDKTYNWRYRLTVAVETPEGLKTGSAVREIQVTVKPRPGYTPYPYHFSHKMKGEAVVVDLGERGVLFALISRGSYPEFVKTFKGPPAFTPDGIKFYSDLKNEKGPLELRNYPGLVTFTDLNDPNSVTSVLDIERCYAGTQRAEKCREQGPHVVMDRFEELFGKGVRLKEITAEATKEPVTWGVEKWLPWFDDLKSKRARLNGKTGIAISTNELADNLGTGSFSAGR